MKYTEEQIIQIKLDYPDMTEESIKDMIYAFLSKALPGDKCITFLKDDEEFYLWQIVGKYGIIGDLIKIDDDIRVECHKNDEIGSRISLYYAEDILAYLKEFKITPDTKYQFRCDYRHKYYPERVDEITADISNKDKKDIVHKKNQLFCPN